MMPEQMRNFIVARDWHTWYRDDYWVHSKIVKDPSQQDYINYSMSLEDAYKFETENKPPFDKWLLRLE